MFQDTGTEDGMVCNNYFNGAGGYYGVAAIFGGAIDSSKFSENTFDGAPAFGIFLDADSNNNTINANRFQAAVVGLQIDDAAGDNNRVGGFNDFWDTTTDVVDNGTGTLYGDNIDQNGNWDEGVEP